MTEPNSSRTNQMLVKVERGVAVASLVAASLGLIEKGVHYGSMVKRKYVRTRHPDTFGFRPSLPSKHVGKHRVS